MVKKFRAEVVYEGGLKEEHYFEVQENELNILEEVKAVVNASYEKGINGVVRLPKTHGIVFINVKKTTRISFVEEIDRPLPHLRK